MFDDFNQDVRPIEKHLEILLSVVTVGNVSQTRPFEVEMLAETSVKTKTNQDEEGSKLWTEITILLTEAVASIENATDGNFVKISGEDIEVFRDRGLHNEHYNLS